MLRHRNTIQAISKKSINFSDKMVCNSFDIEITIHCLPLDKIQRAIYLIYERIK